MNYNPDFMIFRSILSEEEKAELLQLSKRYSLAQFLSSSRNYEEMEIDFVYTSAKIEGNTYSRLDTDQLLRRGITAGGKTFSDAVMLVNLREAFKEIISINDNQSLDEDYIEDLHKKLMRDLLPPEEQGLMRTGGIHIGGTHYHPLDDLWRLRGELKYMLQTASHYANPFEKSIYIHCNLAYLQYFRDGNKRTARMMQTAVLAQSKILPLFFDERLIDNYISSLIHYYETGNYHQYVDFFKNSYALTIEKMTGVKRDQKLSEEMLNRVAQIEMISGSSSPACVFRDMAKEVITKTGTAHQVNWYELERQVAVKSVRDYGYSFAGIADAICRYSPTCITPEAQETFKRDLERMYPDLIAQFQEKQNKHQERQR